jgi:hypothetical protein
MALFLRRARRMPRLPAPFVATVRRAFVLAGAVLALPASAEVAVGARAGTLGIGPEVAFALGERLDARLVAGFFQYGTTYDQTGIEYDAEAELGSALLLLDWHPTGGAFRLTVGGGWNGTGVNLSAPAEELLRNEVPELPPLPFDLGTVDGRAEGQSFVPYAGFGWGKPFGGGRWALSLDLGVVYHGEPEVELGTTLPFVLPGELQRVLDLLAEEQEAELEEELRDFTYMPAISLGLSFRL